LGRFFRRRAVGRPVGQRWRSPSEVESVYGLDGISELAASDLTEALDAGRQQVLMFAGEEMIERLRLVRVISA
jgi:hypothetical protein